MKVLLFSFAMLFQASAYAGTHVCDLDDFVKLDERNSKTRKGYSRLCEKSDDDDFSVASYYPTEAFNKYVKEKGLKESDYIARGEGFFRTCNDACREKLKKDFTHAVFLSSANAQRLDEDVQNIAAANKVYENTLAKTTKLAKDKEKIQQEIEQLKSQDSVAGLTAATQACEKSGAASISDCVQGKLAQAKKDLAKKKWDNVQTQRRIAAVKKEADNMKGTLGNALKGLDKAYGNGKFHANAVKDLQKALGKDALKKSADGAVSIDKTCAAVAQQAKADAKKLAACQKIKDKKDAIARTQEKIADLKKDIEDSNITDLLKMDLEAKLAKMELDDESRKIALEELDKSADKALDGTMMGRMMDQVREDICTVANNPKAMCTGTAYNVNKFVDDSNEIIKEAKRFQKRNVSSSSAAKQE